MRSLFANSLKVILFAALFLAAASFASAQQSTADAKGPSTSGSSTLSQAQIDEIIQKFAAKETQFRRALNQYAFKRDALIQTLGMGGQVTGEYHRVSDCDSRAVWRGRGQYELA